MTLTMFEALVYPEGDTGRDFNVGYGLYRADACGMATGYPVAHIPVRAQDDHAEDYARLFAQAPAMAALLLSMWQHVSHGGPTRGEVEDVLRAAGVIQ